MKISIDTVQAQFASRTVPTRNGLLCQVSLEITLTFLNGSDIRTFETYTIASRSRLVPVSAALFFLRQDKEKVWRVQSILRNKEEALKRRWLRGDYLLVVSELVDHLTAHGCKELQFMGPSHSTAATLQDSFPF
jgi:hypothetical protein